MRGCHHSLFGAQEPQTDSAVSMCSSDNEYQREAKERERKKKKGKRTLDKSATEGRQSKTLTEKVRSFGVL